MATRGLMSCCPLQSSVMSLSKVLVREKGDTRDSKGLYVICQSKTEPEMYELVCRTVDDRRRWVANIRDANAKCPEDGEASDSRSALVVGWVLSEATLEKNDHVLYPFQMKDCRPRVRRRGN